MVAVIEVNVENLSNITEISEFGLYDVEVFEETLDSGVEVTTFNIETASDGTLAENEISGAEVSDLSSTSPEAAFISDTDETQNSKVAFTANWSLTPLTRRPDMLLKLGREIWEGFGEFVRGVFGIDDNNTGFDKTDGMLYVNNADMAGGDADKLIETAIKLRSGVNEQY
jgi:hypothetical protein